jgi:hypothetical protein
MANVDRSPYGGLSHTHETMARFIADSVREDRGIRALAAQILKRAGFPTRTRDKAQAILDYVRAQVGYASDPPWTEYIQKAHVTLCTDTECVPMEDCDGHTVALVTLLICAGIDARILALDYGPGKQPHVMGIFQDDDGRWLEIDSTTDKPIGHNSFAMRKQIIDPFDPRIARSGEERGVMIGAGRPPQSDRPVVSMGHMLFGRELSQPPRALGAGLVTPMDILAYRSAWNTYVLDTVRVAKECSAAMAQVAAQQTDPKVQSILSGIAQAIATEGQDIYQLWNVWHDQTDESIVVNGAEILKSQQSVVLSAGSLRQQMTTGPITCGLYYHDDQGNIVQASDAPDPSVQAEIIANIEGLGILAKGVLRILFATSTQALVVSGSAAEWAVSKGRNTGNWLTSPWTIGIGAVLIVAGVSALVWNLDKVTRLVSAAKPL